MNCEPTPEVTQAYRVPESVVAEQIDGETILLGMESGLYFGLDPIGSFVWRALGEGHSVTEVVAELHQRYPTESAQQLKADVQALIDSLVLHQLLV